MIMSFFASLHDLHESLLLAFAELLRYLSHEAVYGSALLYRIIIEHLKVY